MTKLRQPLLSFFASGRLTEILAFRRSRGQNIAEVKPEPEDTKSLAQLSWRHMYQKAVALWHALSAAEKQDWESQARRRHMTGYAWFMSQALKPNPGLYLPLQGGTMAGDIDMAKHRILKLPVPTDAQEAATKNYVDTAIPPGGYTEGARVYHNTHQAIPNATYSELAFNSQRYDTDGIHDPVVNNSRLTCKTPGIYAITATLYFETNNVGFRHALIRHNITFDIAIEARPTTIDYLSGFTISSQLEMLLNEYVRLFVYQTSGAPLNVVAGPKSSPEFMMQRIG